MPKFGDFLKKAKEIAEKGAELVRESMAFEYLLKDFDEVVANTIAEVVQGHGYRVIGQREEGDAYVLRVAVEDEGRVKPIIERDMRRHYSPRDMEKVLRVMPDTVVFRVYYAKGVRAPKVVIGAPGDDTRVEAELYYFVERRGGFLSKVKRDERRVPLGAFSFLSTDFIDAEEKRIDREKLREYLEGKLRGFGLL